MKSQLIFLKIIFSVFILFGTTIVLEARDIYLSATGNDKNNGLSLSLPLKTFSRANTLAADGDVIHVSGFINIKQEPNDGATNGNGANINGSNSLVIDGVTYNTWNIRGNGGIKILNKQLTILGDNRTTSGFDGAEQTRLFRFDGNAKKITFRNLTLKNGCSDFNGDQGAGLHIRNANPDFESCDFIDNKNASTTSAQDGGGVFYTSNNAVNVSVFRGCTFRGNYSKQGGAFHVRAGNLDVLDCLFEGNGTKAISGSKGGAFFIRQANDIAIHLQVKNTVMINNEAHERGGAINYEEESSATQGSIVSFESCAIISNRAINNSEGGGVSIRNAYTANILKISFINTTFFNNSAVNSGGAIHVNTGVTGSELNIINCTITGNKTNEAVTGPGIRFSDVDNTSGTGTTSTKRMVKRIYNSILENNFSVINNQRGDIAVKAYTPETTDLIIANSFIGKGTGTFSATNYTGNNAINYDSNTTPTSKANFGLPIAAYMDEYRCVPLNPASEAIGYGSATYLQALSITTDQLGKTRPFVADKCNIGAVETDKDSMELHDSPIIEIPETPPFVPQEVSDNNWYIGNTQAGEWIKFKQVWLSAGNYRFTTNAVSKDGAQTVHLEINENPLQNNILVPSNGTNTLELVHLGYTNLETGFYDMKLVFETGNVNCDMIFIKKSDNTSSSVQETDTEFHINSTDGPHICPIGGAINASSQLAKGTDSGDNGNWKDANGDFYSRAQMLNWYRQQIYAYTPESADRTMDYYVSEQVEAKVDFIFAHGRGEVDLLNDVEDRAYSGGSFGCRNLKKLVEAINRSKYAKDNLKIAFFSDNGVYPGLYQKNNGGKTFVWTDPDCQEYIWHHLIETFFDNVPRDMVFEMEPGYVPIQMWTSNSDYTYTDPVGDRKIKEFLEAISNKMFDKYGFRPGWVLAEDFFRNDPRLSSWGEVKGIQGWFAWGVNITSMVTCPANGKKFAFALNGGRHPISNRWLNDWDPVTNTGTLFTGSKPSDYYHSALDADHKPVIRPIFEQAITENAEWVALESWSDWSEGSTWYRSDHPGEYAFPNQHLAFLREFADRNSESILLEAEACDEYFNRSSGNKGGTYRVNWYQELDKDFWESNKEINLDIYRPLHKLTAFTAHGKPSQYTPVVDFAVGNKDVWGVIETGAIYAHQADGIPAGNWPGKVSSNEFVNKLTLGGNYAWCITKGNKVMRTEIPLGETYEHRGWQDMTDGLNIKDISTSLKDGWTVDMDGKVYYRDLAGKKSWMPVPGRLKSIAAEDQSVWGFTPGDSLVRMSSESRLKWDTIPNPHRLKKISAGSAEVWGINDDHEVYRINASGDGDWQFVVAGYNNVGVGMENVWLSDPDGNFYSYKISGFEATTAFSKNNASGNAIDKVQFSRDDIRVAPTRFDDYLRVDIRTDQSADVTFNIYNISGQLLKTESTSLHQGFNSFNITNLGSFSKGIYILTVTSGYHRQSFKIMK